MSGGLWALVLVSISVAWGAPGPDCSPALLNDQPPSFRNLCAALYQLSNAYEALVEDNIPDYQSMPILREVNPVFRNPGVKREDKPDHIFLRFGRRR